MVINVAAANGVGLERMDVRIRGEEERDSREA
jgi:hypothetical protein